MAKHKRLKPIREYLFDKGEMIEQMFSSIPIVEVRNMVPMKLQGMPLHELKAECLVELLEMSDREIMNILEGKKSREEPSSSESEGGGVVVISDDDKRIKKERRSNWRPTLRNEDSDGSSTERSSNNKKKKNKRKSKEKDDPKGRKKIKVESRQPAPSRSKDVPTTKEMSRKKKVAKAPERPKPPVEEVVVLDDISSEEDVSEVAVQEDVAKEGGKRTGEKSLLDLLELEMRARAIRSLLKKEEETQAQRILSEYQDEPDDLIPVEVDPPQVDLLSDSDEESNPVMKQEPSVQPSTGICLELEVEGDTLLSKDVGVLDSLLGIERDESSDVVEMIEVDELLTDSAQVNPSESSPVMNTIKQSETSKSNAVIVEETESLGSKNASMDCEIIVKVEKNDDEPNLSRKIEFPTVKSTLGAGQHSSKSENLENSSIKPDTAEVQVPKQSVVTKAEIVKLLVSCDEPSLLSGEGMSNQTDVLDSKSSSQPADNNRNNPVSIKKEPEEYDDVFAASKVAWKEVESSKTVVNAEHKISPSKIVGIDTKEAQEVSNSKSGGGTVIFDPSSSVESKPQSISGGYDYHSNFDEDILDYDYDLPLNNSLRQPCSRSSPSDVGNLVLAEEKMNRHIDVSRNKMTIPCEHEEVALELSDDDEHDSIQPAELVLNQDKCDSALDLGKERRLPEQCTSESCNSANNFLVRDALGSPELPKKTTVESQEHVETGESPDLVEDEHGRCRADGSTNAESASQSANIAQSSISDEVSSKMTTPKVNEEVLDLTNYKDSNSVQSTELMTSDKVKNYCASLGAKEKPIPPDQCVIEGITNESKEDAHFLVIDSLDSQDATIESQENETDLPISSSTHQMDGNVVTHSHHHHHKANESSDAQLQEINTGRQDLVEKYSSPAAGSLSSAVDNQECENISPTSSHQLQIREKATTILVQDFPNNKSFEDGLGTLPGHESSDASLLIKDAGKQEEQENHDLVNEDVSMECNITEEQHFLVDAALDSLKAERSKTKTLNQEPSELYLGVEDDVLQRRARHLSNQNKTPDTERIRRGCGVSEITETLVGNHDSHFLGDKIVESLKAGTSVMNQKFLDSEVFNEKVVLGEENPTVPVTKTQENIRKESCSPEREAQISGCVTSINSTGQGKDKRPFDNETTAFVGCNSIEIQKTVQITDGQAVSQTISTSGVSHESLTMDCIVVSSEEEDELIGQSGNNLDESIASPSKNIPDCDDSHVSCQCASQRHPSQGFSGCDVLISSDGHSSHGTPCLKKIPSNEGDPPKFPCSRAIKSTCEPTQPSLTDVKQRGTEPPSGKMNEENQTFSGIERSEAILPHRESPCISPTPSSIVKASGLRSSVALEVQAEKGKPKLIENDHEYPGGCFSDVEQTSIKTKTFEETQSNLEQSCVSFVAVSSTNASLPGPSQVSLPKMEEVPEASKNFVETTSQSGSGKYDSEVIEIFDEDSGGCSTSKEKDSTLQRVDSCPTSDPNSKAKTSTLVSTASKSVEVLGRGNCNLELDISRGESSGEKKQTCSDPCHLKNTSSSLRTCFPSAVPCYASMTFSLEPSQPTNQLLGLQTNQSGTVNDDSEVIEIDDDSAECCSEREPITHEAKSEEDSTPQGDSAPTLTSKTSTLELTQRLSSGSNSLVLLKQRNSNSDVEKQTCDGIKESNLKPNQSGTVKNNSEVIEIDDDASAVSSCCERMPVTHQGLEDPSPQQRALDATSINKTSTLKQTKPFSATSPNMDQTEKGNSNSVLDVTKEKSSDVYIDEEKQTRDGPSKDISSSLETTPCPLGLKPNQSVPRNDKSEVIEIDIDDDASAVSNSSDRVPVTHQDLEDPQRGVLDATSITKTSTLKQTKPFSATSTNVDQTEKGNSNSVLDVTKEKSSDIYMGEEKQTCDPCPLGLKTNQSVPGNDKSEVIEIDDEDSAGSCGESTCKDDTTQGDPCLTVGQTLITTSTTSNLEQKQPFSPESKNVDLLANGNSHSEVNVKSAESSGVSKDEENRTSDGPDHLEETASLQKTHFSSVVPHSTTKTDNINTKVIEIDDEDLDGICRREDLVSNVAKNLEETTPHQGNSSLTPSPVTGEFQNESGNNQIVIETNHCEVIEIDDEDSKCSSSGEDDDSDTSSEESQQSYDTVHSISDDEVPNGSQLHEGLGPSDKMETETRCITVDVGVNPNEQSLMQNGLLPLGEDFSTRQSTVLEEVAKSYIIDISDSSSEDPQAGSIGHQESESVMSINDVHSNVDSQSALVQKVDTNVTDDVSSNLIPEPDTLIGNNSVQNVNYSVDQPSREPSEKELEEGEIEGSDGVPETIEDYGSRKARHRPHKKRLLYTTTDSDSSDDSIRRRRLKRRLKLRKKRRKIIPELHKIGTIKAIKDTRKYQENPPPKDLPTDAVSGFPTITVNMSEPTTMDTVVIEDDGEEIMEAIAKQMPPEILELDDSDEAKTNWTARWLESSHVKKVVTTSKILTNARKKMKMKLKVPEIETAPLFVEAPKLIGSVEEYHRLVKEGVITSSSKDTSSETKCAAEKLEAMPSSEADGKFSENVQIDKACSPNDNEVTRNPCFPADQLQKDSLEKKADGEEIVKNVTIVPLSDTSISAPSKESPLAPLDENSSVVPGKPDLNSIDKTEIPKVGEEISEVPQSNLQPLTTEMITVEDNGNTFDPVNLDPISSSIKSFYEMMNPNQVVGFDLYSKSLSDIPIPHVVTENNAEESITTVSNEPTELPLEGPFSSRDADSNTVGVTNQSVPSNNLKCDVIEDNSNLTVETKNLSAAKPTHLSPGNDLEEGEIVESDNDNSVLKIPNNIWVNTPPQVQSTLTIPSTANASDNRFDDNIISTQPGGSPFSAPYTSSSVNPVVPTASLSNQYTPTIGNYIGSLPNPLTNQIVGQPMGIVQSANIAGSSSLVHPAHFVSSTSRSTLSSVVPPSYSVPPSSYNVPGGQATPSIINSALPNTALSGVHPTVVPMNPIQAATAEINNHYPYGDPTGSSAHPQMSVNVNSTLHMYDPYYSWVYRQGLSGSLNSSYGYGTPEQSQDAGTIFKQWGEYYKKLMEACQDSAARAGVSAMFEPPNMVESKGYSWVFERPNQPPNVPPTVADTAEASNIAPKEVEPVPSQAPSGEWNYRYGLKGLLNEHFVKPGITPLSTSPSSTPHGDMRGRRRAGRGRRKRKKKT